MLGASRTSQRQLAERLEAVYDDPTQADFLGEAGTGVLSVVSATDRERTLRTLWADTATPSQVKDGVLAQLFGERIPQLSRDIVTDVIHSRWSNPGDMSEALEEAGESLLFMAAEKDGRLDQVEEELFRFGRSLDASPQLQMALTDPATSPEVKTGIIEDLVVGKSDPITSELLVYLAGHLRGRRMGTAVKQASALAAIRRNRIVAEVRSATPLDDSQKERLSSALSGIRGRDVLVNVTVDPAVIGGIEVRIGDELIDGTLSNRIEQARRRLTS
jgi:F-type H+-transporting ATPase subunit delta